MILLLALLWAAQASPAAAESVAAATVDPRIEWVELQRAGRLDEAVASVERHLDAADRAVPGAHYLRGLLLLRQGRPALASEALAEALNHEPEFEPWIRFRLAEAQIEQGHPEVAAGLLATLLGSRPPAPLRSEAAVLLAATLERGGDCRLLTRLDAWRLDASEHRPLRLWRADCRRAADRTEARADLVELLAEDTSDGSALTAAERLAEMLPDPPAEVALDMAMAFFGQRDFARALDLFARALAPDAASLAVRRDYEVQYAVARSHFWLGSATEPDLAAKAWYQEARCHELEGRQGAAEQAYARALEAEPTGSWSGAAQSARLRVLWLAGQEGLALDVYAELGRQRRWHSSRARSALFLAASDLVQGRADRATAWLATAAATRGGHPPELDYWQGRLAEAQGDPVAAVASYRRALIEDPWDPWSAEAARRLAQPQLAAARAEAVADLLAAGDAGDLLAAWRLTPDAETAAQARDRLVTALATRPAERAFLELAAVPTPAWPLWQARPTSIEERLLGLGDWRFGAAEAPQHFPYDEAHLGLTRARALAEAGQTRASIRAAEILGHGAPESISQALWPSELVHALYPLAYGELIRLQAGAAGFDPLLLAAVIREESRFDPRATSPAAARGLTQFVLPTARRLGRDIGLGEPAATDLYRPAVAIQLGAAYLAELSRLFDGAEHMMLAAYNAGEHQAALWHAYCLSDEPAEYLTKVGFRETRGYLRKVLRSRARYRELYPSFGR